MLYDKLLELYEEWRFGYNRLAMDLHGLGISRAVINILSHQKIWRGPVCITTDRGWHEVYYDVIV